MNRIYKKSMYTIMLLVLICSFMPISNVEAYLSEENSDIEASMTLEEYYKYKEEQGIIGICSDNFDIENMKLAIYEGLNEINESIDISDYCKNINNEDYQQIFDTYFDVLYEKPDIFYTATSVSMSYSYDINTGLLTRCILKIRYPYDKEEIVRMKSEFSLKVDEIKDRYLSGINDELQQEYIIHDYILSSTSYDYDNYLNGTIPEISHTAYGALINGVAVCDGYSKASKLLFNEVGIESGIITSSSMNHAWNYVKINNEYYHFDATWDDPVPETNRIRYDYFNLSDKEMSRSHYWVQEQYPNCNKDDFLFLRNGEIYSTARVSDRLYFFDYNNYSITSKNLTGSDARIELNGVYGSNFVSYNNTLNFVNGYEVFNYNTVTKEITSMYKSDSYINNLYIKGDILFIATSTAIDKVSLFIPQDINYDSVIDIKDIAIISLNYGIDLTNNIKKVRCDLNNDGVVDLFDLVLVSKYIN